MEKIRWGVAGTGFISNAFAQGMQYAEGNEISAVASRDIARAGEFAKKYGIAKTYGSYWEMAQDRAVDIVYIGTPNTAHLDNILLFLNAGIHVLCEKPMGVNEKQVRQMTAFAKEKKLFLMEGMWTRFFPAMKKSLEWARSGLIGTPRTLYCNLGIDTSANTDQWRYKPEMAGGALMDVGIYPLAAAFAFLGAKPQEIVTAAVVDGGVDKINMFTLHYPDGMLAVLGSALAAKIDNKFVLAGSEGSIVIGTGADWFRPQQATLYTGGDPFAFTEEKETFFQPYEGTGFQYEIQGVANALRQGLTEAPEMTWNDSLQIAAAMDLLRGKWGVRFNEDD